MCLFIYERENFPSLSVWHSLIVFSYLHSLNIHFIHERVSEEVAEKKHVYPLLLLHGWPGSVREFYDFIPMLVKDQNISDYAFDVVAPSLVGYGWSDVSIREMYTFNMYIHMHYYISLIPSRPPPVWASMPLKWLQ